ncbi:MAG: hypothetical protein ACLUI3_16810 [Christensenellales bacterium]
MALDVQFVSTRKRALAYALPLAICLLLLDRTIYANRLYLKRIWNTTRRGLMTRVLDRVEQLDGYEPRPCVSSATSAIRPSR